MVVPVPVQQQIAQKAPLVAYVPARLAIGWRFKRWTHAGALRITFSNKAGREIVFVAAPFKGNCRSGMEKSFQLAGNKVYWAQAAGVQQAWRCVNGMKLAASTSLPPNRFADVGLGRIAASGHRIRS
jgi:hypothetical protein